MSRPIRTLLFSTLFPSSARPTHGVFVETRLRELLKSGQVETQVVAPVPWFPSRNRRFGDWARMASTPAFESRDGVHVHHPRYFLPPKIGMTVAPLTLALGARATIARLINEGFDFDLIDAHYYYPDGVAAALLARWFKKPFVVTARGTDLNLIPDYPLPRRMIQWTAAQADGSIGVCKALMDVLRDLGADGKRLHVMRNGVDLQRFAPQDQAESRAVLGLPLQGRIVLSVGHLVERKGHHLAIEALDDLPDVTLVIVGDGEERARLRALANDKGLAGRVVFAGARPNTELARWYSAADALILASSREGWANVLLESMACGTPVVATRIWGTPEVVASPEAGELLERRDAKAIAAGVTRLFARCPDRHAVRRYAEGFAWGPTTDAQVALFAIIRGAAPD
ncbi:glycosyltransferase family 4 protein [Niveibacterium sp. 24ML]|uniref:glycosyltransferase family 4 protein n=1 Tax=Niveibacterium sp. 24ML TaxID=2985512 RepID=UPI0022715067|nr:glycosyltransferase family 4 protein [Niveibacterium sp. 24ML]MCX9156873.1 glycosyltransferase family 4 protein [Niveibacterium sp. 24ML]